MLLLRGVTIADSHVGSVAEMSEVTALARQGTLPALPVPARPQRAAAMRVEHRQREPGAIAIDPSVQ